MPRSAQEWMGNTAMQEVATVLVAHSGLVPEGSSRSRAASELAEMFARADGETEALPDKGRRRSSLRARVPSRVDRIARVGRIACR